MAFDTVNAVQSNTHGENDDGTDQPRNDNAQFGSQYPNEAFIEAIEAVDHAATSGVADRVGCDHSTAYRRLKKLVEAERVEKIDLGNNVMWTLPEN